ncbi:MAG TPA: hypothetical protein PLO23_03070 [Alphaproteobacteria bacterium]|nr:hypothetical protein [Alphaproteobacteria bacterium]
MDAYERQKIRLSDRILSALELALEQQDLKIAEALTKAMELAMTRNSGGGEFIERRDYPPEMEGAMEKLNKLRSAASAV